MKHTLLISVVFRDSVCFVVYPTSLGTGYKHLKFNIQDEVAVVRLDSPGSKVCVLIHHGDYESAWGEREGGVLHIWSICACMDAMSVGLVYMYQFMFK